MSLCYVIYTQCKSIKENYELCEVERIGSEILTPGYFTKKETGLPLKEGPWLLLGPLVWKEYYFITMFDF